MTPSSLTLLFFVWVLQDLPAGGCRASEENLHRCNDRDGCICLLVWNRRMQRVLGHTALFVEAFRRQCRQNGWVRCTGASYFINKRFFQACQRRRASYCVELSRTSRTFAASVFMEKGFCIKSMP